jgi:hypothetical protein
VVGASRSGTALLRSALNRNERVYLAGETHYFDGIRTTLQAHGSGPLSDTERKAVEDHFLALAHRPFGHGGSAEQSRLDRTELRTLADSLGASGDAYLEAYCRLARTLESDAAADPDRWGEKTPRHVFRLPEILETYPEAQVVCMYRDPRAVVASYRDWRNQGGFDLDGDVGHREALTVEEGRTRASYDPTIASLLWKATVSAGESARERFGPDRVFVQRYEDLATNPEETLQTVCSWLGLEFTPRMLEVPLHNSSFSQFQRSAGVSTAPVDRWRSVLSPAEVATVQTWCGSAMDRLGYDRDQVRLTAPDKARLVAALPAGVFRAVAANRSRMGSMPSYLWRRASLAMGRH